MTGQTWDPGLYDDRHGFVTTLGAGVLDLLGAQPGERVLDLGCGTGDHVAELRAAGVEAVGVDASAEMIERAGAKHPGLPVRVADARHLHHELPADVPPGARFDGPFDAVVSNATLHWIRDAPAVGRSVARVLRPGGRFVAEFGGAGNIATIERAAESLRVEWGLRHSTSPWYFPTVGEYAGVLEEAGFEVGQAWLFDRPTRLAGQDGLAVWVQGFGQHLLVDVPDVNAFLTELSERVREHLHRGGTWWADYRRLRVAANLLRRVTPSR